MAASIYNLYEAKTFLSRLVERAAAGEEIVIAKAGQPKALLIPIPPRESVRKPGGWEDMVIGDDFDEPLPEELLSAFEGKS